MSADKPVVPAAPVSSATKPVPDPVPTDAQLLLVEVRRVNAALDRLADTLEKMAECQAKMQAPLLAQGVLKA